MPQSKQDILNEFDALDASKFSNHPKTDNPEAVAAFDQNRQQMRAELERLMDEPDPQVFAQGMVALLQNPIAGAAVGELGAKAALLRADGKELCNQIGAELLRGEILNTPSPGTFLRSDHPVNGFSKEFMAQNGASYSAAVSSHMKAKADELNIASLNGPDKEPERLEASVQLANELIEVIAITPLEPAAESYLKSLYESALNPDDAELVAHIESIGATGQEMGQTVITNNVMLRLGMEASRVSMGPANKAAGEACAAAQRVFNGYHRPPLNSLEGGVNKVVYSPENRLKVAGIHERLGGKPELEGLDQRFNIDLSNPEARAAKAKADALSRQIEKLKTKPGLIDKIKALRHGGVEKMIKSLESKLLVANEVVHAADKFLSLDQHKSNLADATANMQRAAAPVVAVDQARQKLVNAQQKQVRAQEVLQEIEEDLLLRESLEGSGLATKRSQAESEALARKANAAINAVEDAPAVLNNAEAELVEAEQKLGDLAAKNNKSVEDLRRDIAGRENIHEAAKKAVTNREKLLSKMKVDASKHNAPQVDQPKNQNVSGHKFKG